MTLLTTWLAALLIVPATLLPILNPLSKVPVVAALVVGQPPQIHRRLARQVAVNCWFLMMGAYLIGSHVLAFFNLSLAVVQLAGGILIAVTGWRMLSDQQDDTIQNAVASTCEQGWSEETLKVRSFYPISFPLSVGPGTISAAITLGASTPTRLKDWLLTVSAAVLGSFIAVLAIYLCYRHAARLVALLGRLGTIIVLRLSAFILFCIGIDIAWRGITEMLAHLPK
jgi:multiple antibiotic resistance protein